MKRNMARFEAVWTLAGWHSRFVAANGRIVWTTEPYQRQRAAFRAIEMFTGNPVTWTRFGDTHESFHEGTAELLEVRIVDERATA